MTPLRKAFDFWDEDMPTSQKSAEQRTQTMTALSAASVHAAARYDFRCPPSSLSQTIFAFFKFITGGSKP
jgi:hypothetical protein